MEGYQSEDEQIEALRRWWEENGRSTIAAIAIALIAGFGWQGWQARQVGQAEAASDQYQEFLQTLSAAGAGSSDTAAVLAEQIKVDQQGTTYALFAALHLARFAVESGDLAAAEAELRWVASKADKNSDIGNVAQIRLARVLAASGEPDQALAILDGVGDAYRASSTLARGDIYLAQGKTEEARQAYLNAQALAAATGTDVPTLQAKLQSLSPVDPVTSADALTDAEQFLPLQGEPQVDATDPASGE